MRRSKKGYWQAMNLKFEQAKTEIVVNNPVDWQKKQKIESEDLAVIEIYAEYLVQNLYIKKDFGLQDNSFQDELVNGTKYKFWLHNPKIKKVKANLRDNYAEEKVVEFFKPQKNEYFNYVEDCPLEKKEWKRGRNKGQSYASIDYDCKVCELCVAIDYKHVPHKRLFNYEYSIPQKVFCLGYLKNDLNDIIREIR